MSERKPVVYVPRPGRDALWELFGLSYASWLTIPRILMHDMPDEWQAQMAKLIGEFMAAYDWCDFDIAVTAKRDGKFAPLPEWASRENYRHPTEAVLAPLRRAVSGEGE